jgi:hypothetical protein
VPVENTDWLGFVMHHILNVTSKFFLAQVKFLNIELIPLNKRQNLFGAFLEIENLENSTQVFGVPKLSLSRRESRSSNFVGDTGSSETRRLSFFHYKSNQLCCVSTCIPKGFGHTALIYSEYLINYGAAHCHLILGCTVEGLTS